MLNEEDAFHILMDARQGYLIPGIPLRIKASPIEPSVPCFYVISAQNNQPLEKRKRRKNNMSETQDLNRSTRDDEQQEQQQVHGRQETNLQERVEKHLRLETREARREQENLKAARSQANDAVCETSALKSSLASSTPLQDHDGSSMLFHTGVKMGDAHGAKPKPRLISVKYQGYHGKNSDFWWSESHGGHYGVVVRAMAKVPRKTRAKLKATSSSGSFPSGAESVSSRYSGSKAASLRDRKHGFAGKQFSLIYRERIEKGTIFNKRKSALSNEDVKKLLVPVVPSLVQFWPDPSPLIKNTTVMTQDLIDLKAEEEAVIIDKALIAYKEKAVDCKVENFNSFQESTESVIKESCHVSHDLNTDQAINRTEFDEPATKTHQPPGFLNVLQEQEVFNIPSFYDSFTPSMSLIDDKQMEAMTWQSSEEPLFPEDTAMLPLIREKDRSSFSQLPREMNVIRVDSMTCVSTATTSEADEYAFRKDDCLGVRERRSCVPIHRRDSLLDESIEEVRMAVPQIEDEDQLIGGTQVIDGDLVVDGDASFNNLHIKGNLVVEGEIKGQLVTERGKADYAEWFGFLSAKDQQSISCGHVVQLRSPQQRITLNTSDPGCGPILIISTSPSVAAGKPLER